MQSAPSDRPLHFSVEWPAERLIGRTSKSRPNAFLAPGEKGRIGRRQSPDLSSSNWRRPNAMKPFPHFLRPRPLGAAPVCRCRSDTNALRVLSAPFVNYLTTVGRIVSRGLSMGEAPYWEAMAIASG